MALYCLPSLIHTLTIFPGTKTRTVRIHKVWMKKSGQFSFKSYSPKGKWKWNLWKTFFSIFSPYHRRGEVYDNFTLLPKNRKTHKQRHFTEKREKELREKKEKNKKMAAKNKSGENESKYNTHQLGNQWYRFSSGSNIGHAVDITVKWIVSRVPAKENTKMMYIVLRLSFYSPIFLK